MKVVDKKILHLVLEQAAAQYPQKSAIEDDNITVSYKTLYERADEAAYTLLSAGLIKEGIVATFLESSAAYVTAIIAVMKAGGVFMPIGLDTPLSRINYMLNKTAPSIVITTATDMEKVRAIVSAKNGGSTPAILIMDESLKLKCENCTLNRQKAEVQHNPDDGLYIMFTSGSTGEPKAILGCKKSLSHFIHWEAGEFELDSSVRVSQYAPITFDASLRDIFVPLLTGGTLCIPQKETKTDMRKLLLWLKERAITVLHCVPSLFRAITKELQYHENGSMPLPSLRYILMAGEPLYEKDVKMWMDVAGTNTQLVNLYGASETTLIKTFHRITERPQGSNAIIPVGKPISNTAVLIIKGNRLCNIGEIGDIYIKTPFAAKGYYGDPELTAKSFVVNPLTGQSGDIVYKTGDLGRYLPDMTVEFIGRIDTQVKVNGIRIELGEIEKALLGFSAIDEVVVTAIKDNENENTLVCYYTEKTATIAGDIVRHLETSLPHYMIPAFYVRLDTFPLNINGKIDKKALPKPDELLYEKTECAPPATELEVSIERIWAEVLQLKRVSVTAPFFETGGQSLKATRIVSRLYRDLNVEVSLKDFFENDTIRKLAAFISTAKKWQMTGIEPVAASELYEVSNAQRRLWILNKLKPDVTAYNMPGAYLLRGKLNTDALKSAFSTLSERHESLRTTFVEINSVPMQKINAEVHQIVEEIDLSNKIDNETIAREIAKQEAESPFNLSEGPLIRAKLIRLNNETHVFIINMHHIISDALSMAVITQEIGLLYNAFLRGEKNPLAPLRIQYKDYAAWQNAQQHSATMEQRKLYWHKKLAGELTPLMLPTDYPRPPVKTFNGDTAAIFIDKELVSELTALSASLFMTLLAIFKIMLFRYTAQNDIIVGTAVANRNLEELEHQIGFFINTLAIRDDIYTYDTFSSVLAKVKRTTEEALEHQSYPFDTLVDELSLNRDISRQPIFDAAVSLNDETATDGETIHGINISMFYDDWKTSKVDVLFSFTKSRETVSLEINYNTDIFNKNTIVAMASHFQMLAKEATQKPHVKISALEIMTEKEKHAVLYQYNGKITDFPSETTIPEFFRTVAMKTPHNMAVSCDNRHITFEELNLLSDNVGAYLTNSCAVKPSDVVGVMMRRSERAIAALIGIMRSGAVYMPIDTELPDERVGFMLSNSCCHTVIADSDIAAGKHPDITVIPFETIPLNNNISCNITADADSAAYLLYTSGSTGKPKGVMVKHRGFINMATDQIKTFGISETDRMLQFASLSFDASLYETFLALFAGAAIVIAGKETIADTKTFIDFIETEAVTMVTLPPVYLSTLNKHPLPSVRTIITAGEAASVKDALFYAETKNYVNAYGPTEASVCIACHVVEPERQYGGSIPIGKPLSNLSVFVLDESLNPVPIGIKGQICVSGVGLAAGYINEPQMTSAAFVPHFLDNTQRLYLTGDIGKWLPDGNIEFYGRKDCQLKIRGFRIEAGEVEHALKEVPNIEKVYVTAISRNDKPKELAAYFTTVSNTPDIDSYQLRRAIAAKLPSYMIPAHFIHIEAFALNVSGKIDQSALPLPDEIYPLDGKIEDEKPSDQTQLLLLEAFCFILGKKYIGIHDNFFTVGGDSIKAIQLASKLASDGLNIGISQIYQHPTVFELAPFAVRKSCRIKDENLTGRVVPLTPVQSWFFETLVNTTYHFNQSVMLRCDERLDSGIMQKVLTEITKHHDTLRMSFRRINGKVIQQYEDVRDFPLVVKDFRAIAGAMSDISAHTESLSASFLLENAPLIKAAIYKLDDCDMLFITAHHLVVDMVSWRILLEDISSAYGEAIKGEVYKFPQKTDSFKSWAEFLASYAQSAELLNEIPYWSHLDDTGLRELPADFKNLKNAAYCDIKRTNFSLNEAYTDMLLTQSGAAYNTDVPDLLLTALLRALKLWCGIELAAIDMEWHGRGWITEDIDLSRTVGWFTALYPVIVILPQTENSVAHIKHVKETLRKTPQKGMGYGIIKYMTPHDLKKSLAFNLKPRKICFNYLGQFEEQSSNSLFRVESSFKAADVSADTVCLYDMDVNSYISDGKLAVTISMDGSRFKHKTVEYVRDCYEKSLKELIEHCAGVKVSELTPDDIDYDGLSIEELDNVLDNLEEL
ncbi:amino acid adenylation domain-containing protein [Candidatus Magnetomonas plexicatena]|uniref:amino acid adenylation domain-containing protein n=1 Tax=Candidatus Magnetomonas plexicatena TaxID=2552947 RepID=UPI001C752572|nr:amino acid adenylation domain-containing protein [Nitrospirales bacterium LBB_01]